MEPMEISEFTKKSQVAAEALRDVLECIDGENEELSHVLWESINTLDRLGIPEGPFIGRSVMKCLLIQEEDEALVVDQVNQEDLAFRLREIRLFFDTMDEMGITRTNKEVYEHVINCCGVIDEEEHAEDKERLIEFLKENGSKAPVLENITEPYAANAEYKEEIEEIMKVRPDYFEMGNPESEIVCDESCRETTEVTDRRTFETGALRSIVRFHRPDNCLYKDWL